MNLKDSALFKRISSMDKKTRVRIIFLILALLLLLLLYFIQNDSAENKEGSAAGATQESPTQRYVHSTADMELADGEDNDSRMLNAGSTMEAREVNNRRKGNSLADIYDEAHSADDDIMAELTRQGNAAGDGLNRDVYPAPPNDTETRHVSQVRGNVSRSGGGDGAKSSVDEETPEQRMARRKREMMAAAGYDENGIPLQNSPYQVVQQPLPQPSSEISAQEEKMEEKKSEAPVIGTAQVRRSGDISTLSGGSTGAGQLSSLKKKDQFVNQDKEHLFKVMFPSSVKITSGQRVPVRLLEDMVVDGILVPANTYLSSVVTFGEGRLTVTVSSVELNHTIHILRYEGYDTDGMRGLYCPTSKTEKVAREAGREVGRLGRNTISSSVTGLATQVVAAGASVLERAKGETEINITAGYSFYLRENIENR